MAIAEAADGRGEVVRWRSVVRHRWPLRLMHWVNMLCMLALLGSGLQIFNAHPALYWGEASDFTAPLLSMQMQRDADGKGRGITRIGAHAFDTTGLFGVSARSGDGKNVVRGFPEWATIPSGRSLALGRRWHFFFAWLWVGNGICYLGWGLVSGHLRRDLLLRRREWRALPMALRDHLRPRSFQPLDGYHPLQKLTYLGVLGILAPLAILTGLSMSPQLDGLLGGFIEAIGGRQSARSLHFFVMVSFVSFVVAHVLMVVLSGPIVLMRSMLTGRVRVAVPARERGDG